MQQRTNGIWAGASATLSRRAMLAWLWSVRGAAPGVAPEIDEALRLARQLAPETHLVTPSDALLAAYPFRPLTLADFSLSHGPSTESNL